MNKKINYPNRATLHYEVSQVYIALGSNLQNPKQQIKQALRAIEQHHELELTRFSSLYQSQALTLPGTKAQADYINAVALLETSLSAFELLSVLQQIEQQQGRVRGKKWGARTLDLDILLYADKIIDSDKLKIPHPEMCERNFVIYPLAEISTSIAIPAKGKITEILSSLSTDGLNKLTQ